MRNYVIDHPDRINKKYFHKNFRHRRLCKRPYIVKLRRFLDDEEINAVLKMAEGKFKSSEIVVDGELVHSTTRTSSTAFITSNGHYNKCTRPVERILKKVCYLVGCKRSQIEGLMVVRYKEGEEYEDHHDYFDSEYLENPFDQGGQRIATFFCYLNNLPNKDGGGETEFPKLDISVSPSKGTGVFWWNVDKKGKTIDKTLHQGNVVKSGTKYGLNIWIREKIFG